MFFAKARIAGFYLMGIFPVNINTNNSACESSHREEEEALFREELRRSSEEMNSVVNGDK